MNIQNIAVLVTRYLLGLLFFVFGLNGFFHFLPMPAPSPQGGAFLGALAATGYMFPLIKGVEVISGALLLLNRAVPLALVLLAPILVNIAAYHLLLDFGPGMALFLGALELFLAYTYRAEFAPLFTSKPNAGRSSTEASHAAHPVAAR
jgi:putative oxidoreductase